MIDPNRKFHNRADRDATWLVLLDIAISLTISLPISLMFMRETYFLVLFFGLIIGIFLIALFITLYLISPKRKMSRGIARTNNNLNYLVSNYEGTLFQNIYLTKESKIDNLLVTPYGNYLIEVKTYPGYLSGMDTEKEWRQSIAFHNKKSPVINPVKEALELAKYLKDKYKIEVETLVVLASGNRGYINSHYVYAPNEIKTIISSSDPKRYNDKELSSIKETISKIK